MSEATEIAIDRWKNRRMMAWIAFLSTIAYPFAARILENDIVTGLATHHYTFTTGVVMTYIAGSVLDHWLHREPK